MKHKLVLIFADDSEVIGIDNVLMFNNVLDAENTTKQGNKANTVIVHESKKNKKFSEKELIDLFTELGEHLENDYATINSPTIVINKWLINKGLMKI